MFTNLSRRIPHASDGSFNPYVISNKEAHIMYGNINDDKITKCKTTTINEQPQQKTNERRNFMNYCLTHPSKFSCAVDSFLELTFAIFKDLLKHVNRNEFFEILFQACIQLEKYDVLTDMTVVREDVWTYLRQHCNSFASMSADAVFSDIFTLNTVVMTEELKSLFLIQQSNQSICSSCNNAIIKNTSIFLLYITSLNLHYNKFEDCFWGYITK